MRELASHLGVSHAAHYRWVPDREGLFDLISEVRTERKRKNRGASTSRMRLWRCGCEPDLAHFEGYARERVSSLSCRPSGTRLVVDRDGIGVGV